MRVLRATGKSKKNNYHHGSCEPSLTCKTSSVSLNFTQGTHRNVKNHQVRSDPKLKYDDLGNIKTNRVKFIH